MRRRRGPVVDSRASDSWTANSRPEKDSGHDSIIVRRVVVLSAILGTTAMAQPGGGPKPSPADRPRGRSASRSEPDRVPAEARFRPVGRRQEDQAGDGRAGLQGRAGGPVPTAADGPSHGLRGWTHIECGDLAEPGRGVLHPRDHHQAGRPLRLHDEGHRALGEGGRRRGTRRPGRGVEAGPEVRPGAGPPGGVPPGPQPARSGDRRRQAGHRGRRPRTVRLRRAGRPVLHPQGVRERLEGPRPRDVARVPGR